MAWREPELRDLVADIEEVAADSARRLPPDGLAQVLAFLTKVSHVLEQAYRDVLPVLLEIKYAPLGQLDRSSLDRMRQQLELLAAQSRYRDAEEICSRLSALRTVYEQNLRQLIDPSRTDEWSGLFGLIEEREGRIIMLVRRQMHDLLGELDRVEQQGGAHDLRALVAPKIEEITSQMAELSNFTNRILGLSGERGMLEMLRDPSTASVVVHKLAVFDRRQYVEHKYSTSGANSPIIGAGALVTGGVGNTQLARADLPDLARELATLRAEMERTKTGDAIQSIEIGEVAKAEMAAAAGDTDGVLAALKGAGKWTLGIAEKIGVGLAVAALKPLIPGV